MTAESGGAGAAAPGRPSAADELPEPQRHLGHLIRRAQQFHATLWAGEVSERVSSVQYSVLVVLERVPGISQKDLGDEIAVDRSTLAELVTRMAAAGFIARSRAPGDRRRNVLELTGAGRDLLAQLRPGMNRVQDLLVAGLSEGDAAQLRRLLTTVLADQRSAGQP